MPYIVHGFKLTRGAAIGLDDPRAVTLFIETIMVQNQHFVRKTLEQTMGTINDEVCHRFGPLVMITAMDAETGVPADEFSANLYLQVHMDVPSQRFH